VSSAPSPVVAALLSLLIPGLGQVYAGQPRRGLFLALPVLILVVIVLWAVLAGPGQLLEGLIESTPALIALLLVLLLFFLYHAATIVDAYRVAGEASRGRGGARGAAGGVLVVLLGLAVLLYGIPGYLGVRTAFLLDHVRPPGSVIPSPSFEPLPTAEPTTPSPPSPTPTPATGATPGPTPRATATPTPRTAGCPRVDADWANDGRLNLLLLGADEGPGRFSLRTDTMILLSVDLETCRAALFGFPRNLTMVPLPGESAAAYPRGRFPEFLFALWRRAMEQPQHFPGDDETRGWRAVGGAVQELAGVPIDGMVGVNLNGFVDVVDALGGLWIDVPRRLRDNRYPLEDGSGRIRIDIRRGCQKLDGRMALAYARSRHQDDDYQRMRRQQLVLTAFRRQFDPMALLPRVNDLFDIAEDNLWLFLDQGTLGDMARVASRVDADDIQRMTFAPPRYTSPLDDATITRIRRAVRNVFDGPAPEPTPRPTGSPAPSCPP
jgi:LCP family protein required for cell wall assembly